MTVIALAGRRIDAPDAPIARFPPQNEDRVRERLRRVFEELGATILVASAACGADLVALEVAGRMGLRRVVVLPWERERFRRRSVVDRGATWGTRFDRVLARVEANGDLRLLAIDDDGDAAFTATNHVILNEACRLAGDGASRPIAVPVREGYAPGAGGFTAEFADAAAALQLTIREVSTL